MQLPQLLRRGTSHRWYQPVVVLAAVALFVPMVIAAVPGGARAHEAESLKIGTLFPFSGDLSDFGPAFFDAAQLAANEINAAGGVNGLPIELVRADSATSPQQAVAEARRLVEVERVGAIVGPAASGESLQVAEAVTGPEQVVTISPSSTSPALTIANDADFFFRTTISDAAQGVVLADLARKQGYNSACVLYINNAYGQGLTDAFVTHFTAAGGRVTARVPHEQEQASYASELAACADGEPEVLIALSYPESAGVFLREALEAGNVQHFIFGEGLKTDALFEELGWEYFEGVTGTTPGAPVTGNGVRFDAAYEAEYGELPAFPYLREVYDAVYLIALAAEQANSADSTAIRDALRSVANGDGAVIAPGSVGWQEAVAAIGRGEEINYEGAAGSVDLDANGDVVKGTILLWQIEDGKIVTKEARPIDLTA